MNNCHPERSEGSPYIQTRSFAALSRDSEVREFSFRWSYGPTPDRQRQVERPQNV